MTDIDRCLAVDLWEAGEDLLIKVVSFWEDRGAGPARKAVLDLTAYESSSLLHSDEFLNTKKLERQPVSMWRRAIEYSFTHRVGLQADRVAQRVAKLSTWSFPLIFRCRARVHT